MEIIVNKEGLFTEIVINGDVDASSAIQLDEALESCLEAQVPTLVNCDSLEYISSAGLGVFMSYFTDFEEKEISLVLFGLSESVFKVFDLIGISALLSIVNNKSEAEALLG